MEREGREGGSEPEDGIRVLQDKWECSGSEERGDHERAKQEC